MLGGAGGKWAIVDQVCVQVISIIMDKERKEGWNIKYVLNMKCKWSVSLPGLVVRSGHGRLHAYDICSVCRPHPTGGSMEAFGCLPGRRAETHLR